MLCIGFKGGVEARAAGASADFGAAALIGLGLSAATPVLAWWVLTRFRRLDKPTAGALAATFGSVSVVTFAAGQQHLAAIGTSSGGYMAAVLALMETPAILTALLLLHRNGRGAGGGRVLREVLFGAASVLLLGSFVVGLISGEAGMTRLEVFTGPLFQGALCFFLLDLGLGAARKLAAERKALNGGLIAFAILFPVASAMIALGLSRVAGLGVGDATLLMILAGSASYIAVPAAIRHRDKVHPGQHAAIVDADLFDAVQAQLKDNAVVRRDRPLRSAEAWLKGKVFDAAGQPMSPSFGYGKGGQPFRYYISGVPRSGEATPEAVLRVSGPQLEALVADRAKRWGIQAELRQLDLRVELHPTAVHVVMPAKLMSGASPRLPLEPRGLAAASGEAVRPPPFAACRRVAGEVV